MTQELTFSADLSTSLVATATALFFLALVLLVVEVRRGGEEARRGRVAVLASGALAGLLLLTAVLRPAVVAAHGSVLRPRVLVLVDASRSMDLPAAGGPRTEGRNQALQGLTERAEEARFSFFTFGKGTAEPFAAPEPGVSLDLKRYSQSDLVAALEGVVAAADERPASIVVISDGRFSRPTEDGIEATVKTALAGLDIPVHTLSVAQDDPSDASIRAVRTTGAAVAHQPTNLAVELGCVGLECAPARVFVRELDEEGPARELASGKATFVDGKAVVELGITLDRAGTRVIEVSLETPAGDRVAENNKRLLPIQVGRDRVRVLHVAGRPTYDVRALRTWLKADASVDVVAFFILRTQDDQVLAADDELALIPFPVDELFNEHLPSFDAVVLQDFNSAPYGLSKHLPALARYVDRGGGLIMVGGPDSFIPGHYAGTPLADILPVELTLAANDTSQGVDAGTFTPRLTESGRNSPVLGPLRELIGDTMPEVPGTNVVGDAREGAWVLWEHPTRVTKSGRPMPVLALGEHGSGRAIALTVDGSHRLLFSAFAANAAGRAHGAFWDGLLGWLMRDPRFEPAVIDLQDGCFATEPLTLTLHPFPGAQGDASVVIKKLGTAETVANVPVTLSGQSSISVPVSALDVGGYTATFVLGSSGATAMRRDFACERGGDEWADSRTDVSRLKAIAQATGGVALKANDAAGIPLPASTTVATERQVSVILPPWAWTSLAALAVGLHWIVRRRSGLP